MDENILLLNHMGDHYAEANQPRLAALYFKKQRQQMSIHNRCVMLLFSINN